jgi:hypothetical protein
MPNLDSPTADSQQSYRWTSGFTAGVASASIRRTENMTQNRTIASYCVSHSSILLGKKGDAI